MIKIIRSHEISTFILSANKTDIFMHKMFFNCIQFSTTTVRLAINDEIRSPRSRKYPTKQPAIAIFAYPGKSVIFIYTKGRSIKTKETGSQYASKGGSVMDRLANVRNDLGRWLESNCRALAVSLSSRGIDRIRRRCCDGSCTCPWVVSHHCTQKAPLRPSVPRPAPLRPRILYNTLRIPSPLTACR